MCRGTQLIADFFGSTFKKVDGEINVRSHLEINKASIYAKFLLKFDTVNSYHNFSIDRISKNLLVSATNEKKIIKAIEHKKFKIFGQMWHAERENKIEHNDINLIKNFFK